MKIAEETFETEIRFIKKLFYRTLLVILICTIIALVGYFLHNIDVFGFFTMLSGLSLLFMGLIGFERFEIHNRYK